MTPNLSELLVNKIISSHAYKVFARRQYHHYNYPIPRELLHRYWSEAVFDSGNNPEQYVERGVKSDFILGIINKYASKDNSILEIGCNAGSHLNYLFYANFRNLSGIEISPHAVRLLQERHPDLAKRLIIHNVPVEQALKQFRNRQFDIVYTMSVLEHIHPDSTHIFPQMARITNRFLITIEDEFQINNWRIFPRSYKRIFEHYDLKQIEEIDCARVPSLVGSGLERNIFARIFQKE